MTREPRAPRWPATCARRLPRRRRALRRRSTVCAPRALAACVVVSGRGPITASLYQASKLVAAAAPLRRGRRHRRGGGRVLARHRAARRRQPRHLRDRHPSTACRSATGSCSSPRSRRRWSRRPTAATRRRSSGALASAAGTTAGVCRAPARSCARRWREGPRLDRDPPRRRRARSASCCRRRGRRTSISISLY